MTDKFLVPHKQCAECPFKERSLPGFFGGDNTAQQYLEMAHGEGTIPCHMTMGLPIERHCTGVALYRERACKRLRDADQKAHQDQCVTKYGVEGILNQPGFVRHHKVKFGSGSK